MARGVHCTHRRWFKLHDRQTDRQTPQTSVTIISISCIWCSLKMWTFHFNWNTVYILHILPHMTLYNSNVWLCTCFPRLKRIQYGDGILPTTGRRFTAPWMQTYITPDTKHTYSPAFTSTVIRCDLSLHHHRIRAPFTLNGRWLQTMLLKVCSDMLKPKAKLNLRVNVTWCRD